MLCDSLAVDMQPYDTVIGVLSYDAPLAATLRDAIRATWLASPPNGVLARFVLRNGGQKAYAEGTTHKDTVFLSSVGVRPRVMAHIDRASGPLRSVLGWYKCALARWPNAETIGKAEDDVYAHLTDVHRYLRTALAQSPRPSRLYLGSFETFFWASADRYHSPRRWKYYTTMTEDCRLQPVEEDSRLVYGKFAFAKGPLFILSASLVREILANRTVMAEANITIGVDEERAKFRPDHKRRTHLGTWEDVFVGFAASMAAGPLGGPVTHLGLPFGNQYRESSRDWREPMTISATAIVYHIKNKSAAQLHLADNWVKRNHCSPSTLGLECMTHPGRLCGGAAVRHCMYDRDTSRQCSNAPVKLSLPST